MIVTTKIHQCLSQITSVEAIGFQMTPASNHTNPAANSLGTPRTGVVANLRLEGHTEPTKLFYPASRASASALNLRLAGSVTDLQSFDSNPRAIKLFYQLIFFPFPLHSGSME